MGSLLPSLAAIQSFVLQESRVVATLVLVPVQIHKAALSPGTPVLLRSYPAPFLCHSSAFSPARLQTSVATLHTQGTGVPGYVSMPSL